ncbi:ubiquinone biosynthesis accessory factor UbiJ [Acidihalobacter prosperus]|uniref:Ubiquinone biosynthesis accessory factor UbiJ n=1 Tax=Acidihalobacter prosperus TaxID=160660 RepID=A0A1A6C1G3_9GAMM|nr:SCP2 sterol-binding domain-containing protein [Acidihalobacter prosperus]OBS08385.1 hypothetical protein Thpro_022635 [Acidihalobacter prosperus]
MAMLVTSLAAGLENALNLYLQADPEMAAGLDRIAGSRVALELDGTGLNLMLVPETGGRIAVHTTLGDPPDATIRATPLALLRTALSDQAAAAGSELAIEGDAEIAHRLWSVLRGIELDWEEWLSGPMGDALAHAVAERLRGLGAWGRRTRDHLAGDLGEYVTEEAGMSPARAELDDFMDAVDQLREGLDRLEARLARLESRAADGRA